ncbi:MAG: hypothetical protein PHT63_04660 [Bacteroidales bacterium]|nr:hypothetical protein [Bacteroidales bacterium]
MKRVTIVVISILMSVSLSGQRLFGGSGSDFGSFGKRVTKVVLQGNTLTDIVLADAVKKNWIISPYEFCYIEEYERIKEDTSFNFLLRTDGIFNKEYEPRLEYLTLIKGGPEFRKGLFMTTEYISLPFQSRDDVSGIAHAFLPAFLNIMQNHIISAQKGGLAQSKRKSISSYLNELNGRQLIFGVDDIGYQTGEDEIKWTFRNRAEVSDNDIKENAMRDYTKNTAVSLVISPGDSGGGYCYKLLIGSDNHKLYYFRKHRFNSGKQPGFTKKEIKQISLQYNN